MTEQHGHTESKWFYEKDGKRSTEVEATDISLMIKTGQLTAKNLVWQVGMADWIAIENSSFKTFIKHDSPPPITGNAVKNTVVWFLAFAPLISAALEYLAAALYYDNELLADLSFQAGEFFWIAIIVNIGLSLLDEKRLRDAGHDTSQFKGWAFFVPGYLYKRSEHLKQSKAYFWTWIGLFVLSLIR